MTTVKIEGLYLKDLTFTLDESRPEFIKAAARRRWFTYWRETKAQQTNLKRTGIERPNDLKHRFPVITAIRSITWSVGRTSPKITGIGTTLAERGEMKNPLRGMFAGLGLTPRQQTEPKTTPPSDDSQSSPAAGG